MIDKVLGHATAYGYYKAGGGTMTEAEFTEFMADFGTASQTAVEAARAALASETAASASATTATNKASEATTAAQTATTKAGEASQSASQASASAQTASTKASEASQSASTASTKATEATTAAGTATTAKNDAVSAKTAAETAQTAAETAQEAAEDAAESVSASAAQIATNAADISGLKEDLSDLESDGVVPTSEQMLSDNYSVDSVPYHFRRTASDNADREELEIVGGSVAWNQLQKNTVSRTTNGITYTYSEGSITISGTTDGTNMSYWLSNSAVYNINLYKDHVYLFDAGNANYVGDTNGLYCYTNSSPSRTHLSARDIFKPTANNSGVSVQIYAHKDTGAVNITIKPQLFDLTTMFGSTIADHIYSLEQTTAGAGVALFKSLFPNDYYPYNAGELLSVSGLSEHKMIGKNVFDASTFFAANGGTLQPDGSYYIDNPNKIYNKVFWSNTNTYEGQLAITFIRKNEAPKATTRLVVKYTDGTSTKVGNSAGTGGFDAYTFITASNKVVSEIVGDYGSGDPSYIYVQIEYGSTATAYEPYKAHSYPLDSTLTLRGIPKLSDGKMYFDGDRYLPDGKVERRYGVVDLGTLDWTYQEDNERFFTSGLGGVIAKPANNEVKANILCETYETRSLTEVDKRYGLNLVIGVSGASGAVFVRNTSYTDASALKTSLSGVMLVYKLATPTTEEATPYRHLQQCDPNGTEEFVSTGIVPVGHVTKYPDNLRMKLDNLPWNFASLIAPTESAYKATRNYTTGALLIVNNVLYKATANIANGGTITVGTNVTATTLAEVIAALS